MNEATRKKIVFSCLIVAVIWGAYNLMPSQNKMNKSNDNLQTISPAVEAPAVQIQSLIDTLKMSSTDWGKDPFRIQRRVLKKYNISPNALKWQLSGIMFNSHNPVAIINSKLVKKGELVDKAYVVDISRTEVILKANGRIFTVKVSKG